MILIPHLRSFDKGAFLLVREGVTYPCGLIIWLNFTTKITKIQMLPGTSPPGPPSGRCSGPTGGPKAAPRPQISPEKKIHLPPPLTRIAGSAPYYNYYCLKCGEKRAALVCGMFDAEKDILPG